MNILQTAGCFFLQVRDTHMPRMKFLHVLFPRGFPPYAGYLRLFFLQVFLVFSVDLLVRLLHIDRPPIDFDRQELLDP